MTELTEAEKLQKVGEAIKVLDDSIDYLLAYFHNADRSDLPNLLRAFGQLKDNNDNLKRLAEVVDKLYREFSYEVIPNVLEANGVNSINVDGRNYISSTRINASIPEDKREAGYKWLTDVAKTPELIVQRVNAQQLSSFVKTYFETHAEWPPEEAMTIHKQNYIQVRRG